MLSCLFTSHGIPLSTIATHSPPPPLETKTRKNCLRVTLRERDVRARDSRCSPPCSPPTAAPHPPLQHTPPPLETKTRKNCLRVTLRERDVRARDSRCSPPCSPPTAVPRPPLRHTPPPHPCRPPSGDGGRSSPSRPCPSWCRREPKL